jgi:hypothetical protein
VHKYHIIKYPIIARGYKMSADVIALSMKASMHVKCELALQLKHFWWSPSKKYESFFAM